MRFKIDRGLVAATIAATLLIPAVGSIAGPQKELKQLEDKLGELQPKIARDQTKVASLQAKVDTLNDSLTDLQIEIVDNKAEIEVIESEVRNAIARVEETQQQIDRIEDAANEQAVALYKSGSTEAIDALFNSESLSELDERIEMLGVAAQEKTGVLVRHGRLQIAIKARDQELFDKREELTAAVADNEKIVALYQSRRAEHNKLLTKLRERLGINVSKEQHLASESNQLREALIGIQAKNAVKALGTSGAGFIWPLNGNITSYYGPRWGRMHTGWDIDGYTGQPLVAAKEGKVVLASYYSGYGNAVIVDHGGGYGTLYAHMSAFAVTNGEFVEQGELVGYVGCTGSCTGDHVHFEIRVNGDPVDPAPYMP
jgi:murein DD-endopeptidase MepM/ murein hydrolase activator NlpD